MKKFQLHRTPDRPTEHCFRTEMELDLEEEETSQRLIETKTNRYPLRQYINLDRGFDVHLRPNYYESDQEDEKQNKKKRRKSVCAPLDLKDRDREEEEEHNLNSRNKIRHRRHSEGSINKVYESVLNGEENRNDGDVTVTEIITFKLKKQIVKLCRTGNINVDVPDQIVTKQDLLTDGFKNAYLAYRNRYLSKENISGIQWRVDNCQEEVNPAGSNQKTFLAQLGLKHQSGIGENQNKTLENEKSVPKSVSTGNTSQRTIGDVILQHKKGTSWRLPKKTTLACVRNKTEHVPSNPKNNTSKSQKITIFGKRISKYQEILNKEREKLFQPDLIKEFGKLKICTATRQSNGPVNKNVKCAKSTEKTGEKMKKYKQKSCETAQNKNKDKPCQNRTLHKEKLNYKKRPTRELKILKEKPSDKAHVRRNIEKVKESICKAKMFLENIISSTNTGLEESFKATMSKLGVTSQDILLVEEAQSIHVSDGQSNYKTVELIRSEKNNNRAVAGSIEGSLGTKSTFDEVAQPKKNDTQRNKGLKQSIGNKLSCEKIEQRIKNDTQANRSKQGGLGIKSSKKIEQRNINADQANKVIKQGGVGMESIEKVELKEKNDKGDKVSKQDRPGIKSSFEKVKQRNINDGQANRVSKQGSLGSKLNCRKIEEQKKNDSQRNEKSKQNTHETKTNNEKSAEIKKNNNQSNKTSKQCSHGTKSCCEKVQPRKKNDNEAVVKSKQGSLVTISTCKAVQQQKTNDHQEKLKSNQDGLETDTSNEKNYQRYKIDNERNKSSKQGSLETKLSCKKVEQRTTNDHEANQDSPETEINKEKTEPIKKNDNQANKVSKENSLKTKSTCEKVKQQKKGDSQAANTETTESNCETVEPQKKNNHVIMETEKGNLKTKSSCEKVEQQKTNDNQGNGKSIQDSPETVTNNEKIEKQKKNDSQAIAETRQSDLETELTHVEEMTVDSEPQSETQEKADERENSTSSVNTSNQTVVVISQCCCCLPLKVKKRSTRKKKIYQDPDIIEVISLDENSEEESESVYELIDCCCPLENQVSAGKETVPTAQSDAVNNVCAMETNETTENAETNVLPDSTISRNLHLRNECAMETDDLCDNIETNDIETINSYHQSDKHAMETNEVADNDATNEVPANDETNVSDATRSRNTTLQNHDLNNECTIETQDLTSNIETNAIGTYASESVETSFLPVSNNECAVEPNNNVETNISPGTSRTGCVSSTLFEEMFPDESQDQDLRNLIAALADSMESPAASSSDICINNNSTPFLTPPTMTGMEHYKKRLIHQHEKPAVLSSPCTTTEEEDDSLLGSPSSPASSGQSRDSGNQERRREDGGPKVARKRAVCRSQFRHQNMEIFKLGNSIPTSLCKSKDSYKVSTEKNLQLCYENGGKKTERSPSKSSLTESIINSMEGGKRRDSRLWRSLSLNSETQERQNSLSSNNIGDNSNSANKSSLSNDNLTPGRHILPAIVPELPERRKSRVKSLTECSNRAVSEKTVENVHNKFPNTNVYDFEERNDVTNKNKTDAPIRKSLVVQQQVVPDNTETNNVKNTSKVQENSTSDSSDSTPMNLSMKTISTAIDAFNVHPAARIETNNLHSTQLIPKQPSNIPKKPRIVETEEVQNVTVQNGQVEKNQDGKHLYFNAVPATALDPEKSNGVIVINFPQIQEQMTRMESPNKGPQSPANGLISTRADMADNAVVNLVNMVHSSVKSVFTITSLPVLNSVYIDLNYYLHMPTVSTRMKFCIEEALNTLAMYLLVNLFHTPVTMKTQEFMHKILQLDLKPHMDFLIKSINVIQEKMTYDYFLDHLYCILSRKPQEGLILGNMRAILPAPQQSCLPQSQRVAPAPDISNLGSNSLWMENLAYRQQITRHGEVYHDIPQVQQQNHGGKSIQQADMSLMRVPENLNIPNVATMRPDLYLADNRCIPPNDPRLHPSAMFTNVPGQQKTAKGRPRKNSYRSNKRNKSAENLAMLCRPEFPDERPIYKEKQYIHPNGQNGEIVPYSNIVANRTNSDIIIPREMNENLRYINNIPLADARTYERALIPSNYIENGPRNDHTQPIIHQAPTITNCEVRNIDKNIEQILNDSFQRSLESRTTNTQIRVSNNDSGGRLLTTDPLNRTEMNSNHFTREQIPPDRRAIIISNEIIPREQNSLSNMRTLRNPKDYAENRETVVKQCVVSDVEQYLQKNIIINKNQNTCVKHGSIVENLISAQNVGDKGENQVNVLEPKDQNSESDKNPTSDTVPITAVSNSEATESGKHTEAIKETIQVDNVEVSSTVIIRDDSMEISKEVESPNKEFSVVRSNVTDLDDVVLERISPGESCDGICYRIEEVKNGSSGFNRGVEDRGGQGKMHLETDVSIEKIAVEDKPPKLIKLVRLKRKIAQDNEIKRKKMKVINSQKGIQSGEIVIIDDDRDVETVDFNQNDVSKTTHPNKILEKNLAEDQNNKDQRLTTKIATTETQREVRKESEEAVVGENPIIEDISSEEESSFYLYGTYDDKIGSDPKKILAATQVSHCTLIRDNVNAIQKVNRYLFDKPQVYTKPVVPKNLCQSNSPTVRKEPLGKLIQYEGDSDTFTYSLKVNPRKYPNNVDLKRLSPVKTYRIPISPSRSPTFKSPVRPVPIPPPVVHMSPTASSPLAVQTSPTVPRSPVVPTTQTVMSPILQMPPPPPLNDSQVNWRHWFADEERRNVFNFERSHSMESTVSGSSNDYSPKISPDEFLREIKIDSKVYKVKKNVFDRIPKGKLCYIRQTNTFVRYFDDNQMELFISNLNMGEHSAVAKSLLKQTKGRVEAPSDVMSPTVQVETSGKGEVIALSKDVSFSAEDYLSDPEQYVEEVEKVQRYVPKDFYGFYKFVTGYQIVNNHPPISFQTFLTMHNTNGIRTLFKNYINSLVEGRNVL